MNRIKEFIERRKAGLYAAAAAGTMVLGAVPAFASGTTTTPGVAITEELLQPVVTGVSANLAVIVPVGITIFAIIVGVMLVPKIIKRFM